MRDKVREREIDERDLCMEREREREKETSFLNRN